MDSFPFQFCMINLPTQAQVSLEPFETKTMHFKHFNESYDKDNETDFKLKRNIISMQLKQKKVWTTLLDKHFHFLYLSSWD